MATIRITDLLLRTRIGVNEWEKDVEQDILINITLEYDASHAIQTDSLEDAVDYKSIKTQIIKLLKTNRCKLLEMLVSQILDLIMAQPRVQSATVRVDKPGALRFAKSVSVEISRSKDKS